MPACSIDSAAEAAAAERQEAYAQALELLAELVRSLPEDDERFLILGTLAVPNGQFAQAPRRIRWTWTHLLVMYQGRPFLGLSGASKRAVAPSAARAAPHRGRGPVEACS